MTYNVFGGTLNLAQPCYRLLLLATLTSSVKLEILLCSTFITIHWLVSQPANQFVARHNVAQLIRTANLQ